ncbi:glycine betaine ABC transporter substrate-binding protein [Promicromonospora citrea]|uniref:Glycine/betaine ABC transporter substrate-binding protein n=1 Tax=Promicromonospora citrea TaxID=43677 RepID=A0A8H9GLE3_9MICO|nr:glycine betaine ABC transporter substrate-binding protein [Promicromonospora citrea]NNH52381.1 glycine betaine ABC transporter substrate-binding protein [Promicromonospora citrea]GGM36827.1 glycine/betaine ABC transporter substrate-binding protein [Promicromonospora citrea]
MIGTTGKRIGAATLALGLGLGLTACGSEDGGSSEGEGGGTITLGIIPSWTDGLSTAYLWKHILEEDGYTVEIEEINDAAPLYTGLAEGDLDVYPSAWPEVTHAAYMEEYGDDLEDLGTYYDGAKLTIAVPEYSELQSIEDLVGKADDYDGKIVGIEAGAGLTKATQEQVIPQYGLDEDGWTLQTSSTPAMLNALEEAVGSEEDIVVTLWRPFWANNTFPVRDLEDPKGALGEAEGLHEIATKGFGEEFPEVAEMMANAKLDDEQYGTLEDLVVNEHPDDPAAGVEAWIAENQDWVDGLTS